MVQTMTCGEALVKLLEDYGVTTVFGIPGVHNLELYRGLAGRKIQHILPRHEQGAAFMADGYARLTGKPGICFVITGAGVTNAATPIGQAFSDSVPMLVLSSENPRETLGKGYGCLHEITDQAAVTRPLCAFSETPTDPEDVPALIHRAFALFHNGRPRPVHISLPLDMLAEPARGDWAPREVPSKPAPNVQDIEQAVQLLKSAMRPLILVGGGARRARDAILRLMNALDCPAVSTVAGKDILPSNHPLAMGALMWSSIGDALLDEADVVLAIGTELSRNDTYHENFTLPGKLIRIDIDPMEFDLRFRTAVPIRADAELSVNALNAMLEGHAPARGNNALGGKARAAKWVAMERHGFLPDLEALHAPVIKEIERALPEGAVLVGDMTQLIYTAASVLSLPPDGRFFYPAGYGTLGYALPTAIGAKIADPGRAVLAVAGDSGVLYTGTELAVASELNLPVVLLVWNNRALGQIRDDMVAQGIQTVGVTPVPPDFEALAKAFRWAYIRPSTPAEIGTALKTGFAAKTPTMIEVDDGIMRYSKS